MAYIGVALPIKPKLVDWVDPDLVALNVVVDIQRGGIGPWVNITTMANNATYNWTVTGPVGTAQLRYSNPLDVVYLVYGGVFDIANAPNYTPRDSKPIAIPIMVAI